ncbi:hypothetical protein Droror1_Dr00002665 [Drosera rotundifolia]
MLGNRTCRWHLFPMNSTGDARRVRLPSIGLCWLLIVKTIHGHITTQRREKLHIEGMRNYCFDFVFVVWLYTIHNIMFSYFLSIVSADYVQSFLKDLIKVDGTRQNREKEAAIINKKAPAQQNLDCGVHVCQWIELIPNDEDIPKSTTLEDIRRFRARIVAVLIKDHELGSVVNVNL